MSEERTTEGAEITELKSLEVFSAGWFDSAQLHYLILMFGRLGLLMLEYGAQFALAFVGLILHPFPLAYISLIAIALLFVGIRFDVFLHERCEPGENPSRNLNVASDVIGWFVNAALIAEWIVYARCI